MIFDNYEVLLILIRHLEASFSCFFVSSLQACDHALFLKCLISLCHCSAEAKADKDDTKSLGEYFFVVVWYLLLLVNTLLFSSFSICIMYYICLIYLYHSGISVKGKKRKSQPGTEVTIIP